ncbi:MAG: winged helix-turn-helix domain-containing protein [Anaerolineales bacterium]|nr:winged helix-turn-helix domain-containing protein [Anaerolineales bacterium]
MGRYSIQNDDARGQNTLTHTTRCLLAYLLVYRTRIHTRDSLANLFWEDFSQKRARNCLNTTIWRLRRFLEPRGVSPGTYLISMPTGELGFNVKSNFWLDVEIFEREAAKILALPLGNVQREDILILEKASQLYQGDLLEGYYNDWALRERERLRCCYLDCLYFLMRFFSQSEDFTKALEYGRKILEIDSLREDVHRQLMRLYMRRGQRSLAIRQYHTCQEALQTELAIPPMPETQALIREIAETGELLLPDSQTPSGELKLAVANLQSAMENVTRAQKTLELVLRQFSRTNPQ